MTYKFYLFN